MRFCAAKRITTPAANRSIQQTNQKGPNDQSGDRGPKTIQQFGSPEPIQHPYAQGSEKDRSTGIQK
jgi:hypothetical protein